MAEQRGQHLDDRPAHAGRIEHAAEQHEDRHRQQDDARHALVHAADHHEHGYGGGKRQESQRPEAETEGDRHAENQEQRDETDEEDRDVPVADLLQARPDEPEQRSHGGDDHNGHRYLPEGRSLQRVDDREDQHQPDADRQGGGAETHRNVERCRGNVGFFDRIFVGRPQHHAEEERHQQQGERIRQAVQLFRQHADEERQPQVFAAIDGHGRTEHGKPEEGDRCHLVDPDDRQRKDITGNDPGQQKRDDADEKRRGDRLHRSHPDGTALLRRHALKPGEQRSLIHGLDRIMGCRHASSSSVLGRGQTKENTPDRSRPSRKSRRTTPLSGATAFPPTSGSSSHPQWSMIWILLFFKLAEFAEHGRIRQA
jgi:hypothetical protein